MSSDLFDYIVSWDMPQRLNTCYLGALVQAPCASHSCQLNQGHPRNKASFSVASLDFRYQRLLGYTIGCKRLYPEIMMTV